MSADRRVAPKLVFVYNVDASPVALLRDLYSGLTTGTTDCHLCDLTFGRMLKDRSWKRFVDELPIDVDFQLRSTFRSRHPEQSEDEFPAAYVDDGAEIEMVLDAATINAADDLDRLRKLVASTVAQIAD